MGDPVFVTPTSPSPRRDTERTPARRRAASAQCSRMLHLLIASAEAVRIRHEENERLLRATETRPFNAALPEPVILALDHLPAPAADDAAALAALAVETTSAAPVVPGPPCDPSAVPLPHDSDTEAEIMDTTASRKRQRPSESSDDEGGSRKVPAIAPEEPQSPPTAVDAPPPTDAPPAPSMDEAGFQLVQSKAQRRRERKGAAAAPAPRSNAGTETPTAPPPTAATAAPAVSTAATQQLTVLFRPTGPGAVFPRNARLSLAKALSALAGVRDVRVNTKKNIVAADAATAEWRERLLGITELAGIPVGARLPADRTRSSGILQGILGDHSEEELLAGLESEVLVLAARRQGTALILDFAASAPPTRVRLFRMAHQCQRCGSYGHATAYVLQTAAMPALRERTTRRRALCSKGEVHSLRAGARSHIAELPAVAEGATPRHHKSHCPHLHPSQGGHGGPAPATCCSSGATSSRSHSRAELRAGSLTIGQVLSEPRAIASGVPQGSVLSPLLFNIALAGLAAALPVETRFPVRCIIYVDDKSEIIRIWKHKPRRQRRMTQATAFESSLLANKSQRKPSFAYWVARMISRVATRRHGMREEDILKLVHSLVDQVDAMLRKACKAALKLPPGTPTSKLLALCLHNTYSELCEAQLTTQLHRLTLTPTDRDLLLRLGYMSQLQDAARRKPVPDHLRATYKVAPIPRNMDPRLHQGRREARVEALEREHGHKTTTYYVDAANYDLANTKAVATVVDHTLTERTSASVRCHNITEAEETTIALALALGYRHRRSLTVLTDSQAACRNYLKGRISQPALNILLNATDTGEHYSTHTPQIWHRIIWTPGHKGLEGNQAADG
ncbi:hypothetical protein HPB50_009144 [Hyalomma asiaticum]|uniref:Uncharacterized protein n=1 Tax=Hyalomma asiaticum TaxID=266040 RepID=A0ACB7SWX0_HYAAI|nr:hypothetical protein HPB50_009144 [Hyalomma asiaticum]